MITIKYEIYHNDYNRQTNLTKTFPDLESFGDWLLDHATPYTDYKYLYVDYAAYYKQFKETGRLQSRNYEMNEDYWIYMVSNDDGIIYTNGKYTHGKNHASKTILSFLHNLEQKYLNPDIGMVFVD